jgi:hypothetical protein
MDIARIVRQLDQQASRATVAAEWNIGSEMP